MGSRCGYVLAVMVPIQFIKAVANPSVSCVVAESTTALEAVDRVLGAGEKPRSNA